MSLEGHNRSPQEAEPVGVALVGCGAFGAEMAEIVARVSCLQLVDVCDKNRAKAEELGRRCGVPAHDSFEALLRVTQAEAILLVTPNDQHRDQTIAAAATGRHVFCEKPMALSVADCLAMIEAADRAGVKLMIGHKRRLRPQYRFITDTVRSGSMGRLLAATIDGWHDRPPTGWWADPTQGGGLLAYAGVHDIDFLLQLAGPATHVCAVAPAAINAGGILDAISVLIQFETGAIASLNVTWRHQGVTFQHAFGLQLVLEQGSIVYDASDVSVEVRTREGAPLRRTFDRDHGFVIAYDTELTSFANWIRIGSPPVFDGWDGLRCVAVIEAAHQSVLTQRVVAISAPGASDGTAPIGPPV